MNCMFLITNESQIAGFDLIVLLTMQGDLSTYQPRISGWY